MSTGTVLGQDRIIDGDRATMCSCVSYSLVPYRTVKFMITAAILFLCRRFFFWISFVRFLLKLIIFLQQLTADDNHHKSFLIILLYNKADTEDKKEYLYIMENKFIPDAIEIVQKAINADNEGEYEKALNLYRDALGRFTMGLKYEKNEARKKLIIERVEGYMKRAEELRDYINKQNELGTKGGGGTGMKKKGESDEDPDEEKNKLRGALSGAIVTEKPDVKWDDVAGLQSAKDSLKEVRTPVLCSPHQNV